MGQIEAMKAQEDTARCYNYFIRSACKGVDEECRTSMVSWCHQMAKALSLKPQTSWIAISYFDRYLSSGKGKSISALADKYTFQLSAIASFYIAIKMHDTVQLNAATLAKLCKGYYAKADILKMEEDILFALDWRVNIPTPMDFARHMLHLLPEKVSSAVSESLLGTTQKLLHRTTTDLYFTFCKPSVVGASCLSSALAGTDILTSSQRQEFWLQLARFVDLIEVMDAQNKLLKGKPISKPSVALKSSKIGVSSKPIKSSRSKNFTSSGISSPTCVTESARQR